jgi:hypothetical protein
MTNSRKIVLKETAFIAAGEAVCVAVMFLVYFLIEKFSVSVLLGGLAGLLLATGNFFALAVAATLAADRAQAQDVEGGQKLMRSSYPLRLLALAVILFLCAKSGVFDVIALVLPLLFVRPILTIGEFFRKKGE